jgi:endoglucanase
MKNLGRVFACALALLTFTAAARAADPAPVAQPANPSGFVIHRGTNLSHWLSQAQDFAVRKDFITANDIQFIARSGFDHVRLPIDEKELWTEDGKPVEDSFTLLRNAIDWCHANHLRVIVDLHTVRAHNFNAANDGTVNTLWTDPKAQAHFLDLWAQLSRRLHDYPDDLVAYEIMNEPTAENPEDWNRLVAISFKQIRATEPNRVIVIGADMWQIPQMLPKLKVPAGDKNIILSFHTYSPMALTHHEANWISEPLKSYTGPVNYPGKVLPDAEYKKLVAKIPGKTALGVLASNEEWNAARIRQEIEPAVKRAHELGLQLYCGEFGCLPSVPRAARMAYYRDIVGVFASEGVAYANWEYKGDFGILEWHKTGERIFIGAPDMEFIDILMRR